MLRIDSLKLRAAVALGTGLFVGFLAAVGCSEATPTDKREDPALKASMEKSMELYKSKMAPKKGYPGAALKRQS
jgi:hypothetical protein